MSTTREVIAPQPGPQTQYLSTPADIAVYGGAAGGGKTFALLLETLRNIHVPDFGGVIFRRITTQISNQGGLWDESKKLYPVLGGKPIESKNRWRFPKGTSMKFAHLEHEKDVEQWQGSQIPFIGFDELCHFEESQFFYMLSRNRSVCGVKPYIRATCNPDPDSWVAKLISWWIDQDTGYAIPERSGVVRYFARDSSGNMVWGDTPEEVVKNAPHIFEAEEVKRSGLNPVQFIKSFTFIPSTINDNEKLLKANPEYLFNLLALPEAEQNQLLKGNWKVSPSGLELFDFKAVNNLFDGFPEREKTPQRYITCDPARFGRDFCVIMVWRGWEVIHISVFKKSDAHDIHGEIERLRMKFNVWRENVVVDQDGLGEGTVSLGNYTPFNGGRRAKVDPKAGIREYYHNLKTQCYYRFSDRVNKGMVKVNCNTETVCVYDNNNDKPSYGTTIRVPGGKVEKVETLIKQDLRAIKREKADFEGRFKINTKEEQKIILGRSPDFGDSLMMRELFELIDGDSGAMEQVN